MRLFWTGFVQVFLVSINTWLIVRVWLAGIFVVSWLISFVWTYNVRKVVWGNVQDRVIYASGAAAGATAGVLLMEWVKIYI